MWNSRLSAMSVGPLWLSREPVPVAADGPAGVCPDCGQPWLSGAPAGAALLLVLAEVPSDAAGQGLLDSLLRALGGPQQVLLASLHRRCATGGGLAGKVLASQLDAMGVRNVVAFGEPAGQQLMPGATRGVPVQWQLRSMLVTHDLPAMLHAPGLKAEVWRDLCLAGLAGRSDA